ADSVERMFGTDVVCDSETAVVVGVPSNLEAIPPGYVLAAVLDDIDIDVCSGFDRVRVLKAQAKMRSHYAARSYHTMTKVLDAIDPQDMATDMVEQAAASEVAAALRLTRRSADIEMNLAIELQRRLPQVWQALLDGRVDVRRARVLVDGTLHLSTANAQELVAGVLDDAAQMTTGQLRAKLRKLCIQVDPEDAKQRYRQAVEDRRVVAEPTIDGVADLRGLDLPPHRVQAAMRRINRLALDLRHNGDTRTIDQLRADVLLDLLEGTGHLKDNQAGVLITVDLPTLTELANNPGELAGYGPVIADIARQITQHQTDTKWRWALKDPDTGQPIDGGITRRRPTTTQRRKVTTLHPTCIHPGCRMPAYACDLDHTNPHTETRTTCTDDLAPLCRHHHTLKHHAGWQYQHLPNNDFKFTSPLGHQYTTSGRDP
ncbi:MAG: DUF222 domain-containing protein, partial [Acidimicrobiia bacterium]|nr:DUF222 domain-containing protein [Acidimicrobiia bacterium]